MKKIIVFISLIFSSNGFAYQKNSNKGLNEVDDFSAKIDQLIQSTSPRKFSGVILITQNGEKKYSKAFGYSDFENKTPFNLEDNFRIQSNSKQITAVLTLKEVEKGKINLHDSIAKYLPDFDQDWANSVTVHHLLNMSSGIESINRPLLFQPGTDFHYSNPGYGLLRRIIEKVTAEKFPKLVNNLFKELGMKNTYSYEMNGVNQGLINGYNQLGKNFSLVDINTLGFTDESWADFLPAGGVISNLKDLNTWDSKLHNGEVLTKASYGLMIKSSEPRDSHLAFSEDKALYGYGINISNNSPVRYLGHAGTGLGFVNLKLYFPESDTNLIILENVYNHDRKVNYYFESEIRKILLESNLVK